MSGLKYMILSILKTSNIINNKKPSSYSISCCFFAVSDLELFIPWASKSALGLRSVKPSFCLRSSAYPVVDNLSSDIFFKKRFLIIVGSLASKNFTALLICSNLRDNISATRF